MAGYLAMSGRLLTAQRMARLGFRQHRGDRSAHESPGRCRVDTATPRNRDSHGPDADQEDSVDFALADEHAALRKMLRSFFEEEAPTHVIAELDAAQRFPVEIWRKMADLGLCGLTVDEKYGGSAADEISMCIVAEEMSRAGSSLAYAYIPTVTFCARAVQQFGHRRTEERDTPEDRRR